MAESLRRASQRFFLRCYVAVLPPVDNTLTAARAQDLLLPSRQHHAEDGMSLVRLLGFNTLTCGCVVGRYREVATSREVTYVEEKGKGCGRHGHRRNHTVAAARVPAPATLAFTKAS